MQFQKPVLFDSEKEPAFQPFCDAWTSRSLVAFPLRKDREIVGSLVFGKGTSHPFSPVQVKLLWILEMQAESRLQQTESVKMPSFYSFIDPLTHFYNWGYFNHQLEKEILRARRNGESFALLSLDLDGFRAYNERFLESAWKHRPARVRRHLERFRPEGRHGGTPGRRRIRHPPAGREHRRGAGPCATDHPAFSSAPAAGEKEAHTERLSVSVGAASFPSDSFDKADLVNKAVRTLQMARSKGGGKVLTFHETTDAGGVKNIFRDLPIRKIYEARRSVVDMEKFLEILLFTGMQGLSAGRGSIVVKDAEGDFTLRAAIGFSRHEEHITASGGFRAGRITNWVVDHQLPLIVSKPEDSPFNGPFTKNGYQTESFLSIPLTHHGRTLGALHLTNRKDPRPFTNEDLKVFAPITSEIAAILAQGMDFRENVRTFSLSILTSLSDALELRFPFLSGQANRVRDLSTRIGERMGLAKAELSALRHTAELHNVGIVGIPGNLLAKKRKLNEQETELVRKHPYLGSKMLEGVPGMDATRRAILEHHGNDGSGYPYGIRGDDISIPARILSVAEFYDSAVSDRPHRPAVTPEEALRLVRAGANSLFDPDVARLFAESAPPH